LADIGELVVQRKVEQHGAPGGNGLCGREGHACHLQGEHQHQEVHTNADGVHADESQESDGYVAPHFLLKQQDAKVKGHTGVEFAFTRRADAELVRQFFDPQFVFVAGGDDVKEDLEAEIGQAMCAGFKGRAAHHEEAAHWVRHVAAGGEVGQSRRELADCQAPCIPVANAAALGIAAANDQIDGLAAQYVQHLREQVGVMLQVRIHDGYIPGTAGKDALDAGRGQTTSSYSLDAADSGVGLINLAQFVCRAIWRVVIDEDDLPVAPRHGLRDNTNQLVDVAALIERRYDDGQFGWR
jgi:hypothetical protein